MLRYNHFSVERINRHIDENQFTLNDSIVFHMIERTKEQLGAKCHKKGQIFHINLPAHGFYTVPLPDTISSNFICYEGMSEDEWFKLKFDSLEQLNNYDQEKRPHAHIGLKLCEPLPYNQGTLAKLIWEHEYNRQYLLDYFWKNWTVHYS